MIGPSAFGPEAEGGRYAGYLFQAKKVLSKGRFTLRPEASVDCSKGKTKGLLEQPRRQVE